MKRLFLPVLILFITGCTAKVSEINPSALFRSGEEGYACFRIPAIIEANGTLLAFAEGRKIGCSDTGDIDLVLKTSRDRGRTWSGLQVIWDPGENVAGNPAPVYDRQTKTVFLLSTWNLGTDHESQIIAGTSADTRRVFVLKSKDYGKSWSGAREITETTKLPDWTWYATGPVHGIQIEQGLYKDRLVIPCDHIEADSKHYYSHVIYSDDHGQNWQLGGSTPQHQVNECTVTELSDNRLLLNMRNYDRTKKTRMLSISTDGGVSWSNLFPDPMLPEPICQASMISHFPGKDQAILYFINPSSSESRKNMMLKISRDEGASWSDSLVLHAGPAAYSDLVLLEKGNWAACLYEAGKNTPYEGIQFHLVDLENW